MLKNRMLPLLLGLAALVFLPAFPALAETVINCPDSVQPGQPFVLSVSSSGPLRDVSIAWNGKNLPLPSYSAKNPFTSAFKGEIILVMPLDGKEKALPLSVVYTENEQELRKDFTLPVIPKDYPVQTLKVDSKFVDLSEKDARRAAVERKRNAEITARHTLDRMWELPLVRPVPGKISSLFGVRRVFNGQPRNSHRGLDFRAAEGDPIYAVADGTVALAENQFFAGNVAYVDHGLGFFSVYMHMSKINVAEGDKVTRGQLIGKIGSTGRATGPHLHLSLMVHGTGADPLPLLE